MSPFSHNSRTPKRQAMSVHSDDQSNESGFRSGSEDESTSGTTNDETKGSEDNIQAIRDQLSKKESLQVLRLRVIVVLVLMCAATAVTVVVYIITRQAQIKEFNIQYEGVADKVVTSFTDILKEMGAISGLGVAATVSAADTKSVWPFVTMSNFQERAGNARTLSGTLYVSINPLVGPNQFQLWEGFVQSSENNYWM